MVVLKVLILNSFYFGRVWWSWKNWILNIHLSSCPLYAIYFQSWLWYGSISVGYVWAPVNWTQVCSTLDHQMPQLGGTSENLKMSSWPDVVWFLVTRCLYWGTSELGTSNCNVICLLNWVIENWTGNICRCLTGNVKWPDTVPLLATKCLYWGYIWAGHLWL